MDFKGKSIVSIRDMQKEYFSKIIDTSREIKNGMHTGCLKGKVLSTLFFEPSTRTRLSFESAMKHFGGDVIGFAGSEYTSVKKGESLVDT
ncbi:MAG: aspartate carbamoyltransferase, partial [Spirochaetota bacterium]